LARDRNDDGDTLQRDVLGLFHAARSEALAQVMSCLASEDPGLRRVGIWGLSVLDWSGQNEYVELVAALGSWPDEAVPHLGRRVNSAPVPCSSGCPRMMTRTSDVPRSKSWSCFPPEVFAGAGGKTMTAETEGAVPTGLPWADVR
jgi:hypothetical protein